MWLRVSCGGSGAAMGLCLFGVVSGSPRSAAHLQLFGLAAGVWATAGGSEEGCWHGFAVGRVQKQENPWKSQYSYLHSRQVQAGLHLLPWCTHRQVPAPCAGWHRARVCHCPCSQQSVLYPSSYLLLLLKTGKSLPAWKAQLSFSWCGVFRSLQLKCETCSCYSVLLGQLLGPQSWRKLQCFDILQNALHSHGRDFSGGVLGCSQLGLSME